MSTTLTHTGLPEGRSRFDLLGLFETVAKPHFKLSKTASALIRHYILKTSDEDYGRGRVCTVWGQVCNTARSLNLTPRSINEAERELERNGFIRRTTGVNGARSGKRCEGKVIWASGINLAPMIERYRELQAEAEAIRLRNTALDQCKSEIRQINKQIREGGTEALRLRADVILPDGRTARINELERLEDIRDALAAMLAELSFAPRAQKTSDASEENCAPTYTENDYKISCSGAPAANRPEAHTPELQITPKLAVSLASESFRQTLDMFGGLNWPNIVEASYAMALSIGIDRRSWGLACERFGRERAALCVIVIERNASLHSSHRYHARQPQKCLAGMMRKEVAGNLNMTGLIRAMLAQRPIAEPKGRAFK